MGTEKAPGRAVILDPPNHRGGEEPNFAGFYQGGSVSVSTWSPFDATPNCAEHGRLADRQLWITTTTWWNPVEAHGEALRRMEQQVPTTTQTCDNPWLTGAALSIPQSPPGWFDGQMSWDGTTIQSPLDNCRSHSIPILGQRVASAISQIIRPHDPNEKVGPEGVGPERLVSVSDELLYTIYFENVVTATAPAQEVFITDPLDPNLDWSTFQATEIAFGDRLIAVQEDADQFYTQESIPDYRVGVNENWWVDVTAQLDYQTGQVNWTLRTLDPQTSELPEDPLAGFLPPNDASGRGEGHVSFSIRPRADVILGTRITNTATIVFDVNEPIQTNEVWNTVGTLANLSLIKTDNPDPVTVGGYLTYTIAVANDGPDAATGVAVTDVLPVSVTLVSASASQGSCSGTRTVICSLGTLNSGASVTATVVVTATAAGTIENSAGVTSAVTDGDTINNSVSATTTATLPASADLSLTKTDEPDPIAMGDYLTYTIAVVNLGPNTATGVAVTDTLPVSVTLVSASASQGSCSGTRAVICSLGTLNSGASVTATIVVTVTAAGTVENSASVTSAVVDRDTINNSASTTTTATVAASADLSLTKTDEPDPIAVGDYLTYTIAVVNLGPNTTTGVVVTDTLPVSVTFVSASASQGSCSGTHTVTCNLGTLNSAAGAIATIVVTATAAGSVENTASVAGGAIDPNTVNNSATAITTVTSGHKVFLPLVLRNH